VQCRALDEWVTGLGLCLLEDFSSCSVENGLEEGKTRRQPLLQFRWETCGDLDPGNDDKNRDRNREWDQSE
jgi:hypothetical protein